MLQSVLVKFFGSKHERDAKKYRPLIEQINALEPYYKSLTDAQMRLKTDEFKQRLEKGETLDDLLVEAYALVREAAVRVLGQRHFDVQIIGGIVLHQGKIAEMKTGEGKTLMATMPAYLNALTGKGVHIVTPNYYLARRDKEWMGPVYNLLGLSVGLVLNELDLEERMQGYRADITYGVNDAFGFDYLRDNLVRHQALRVQRELNFAIIDEIDFILIDEARTPLIISDKPQKLADLYTKIDRIIPRLMKERDFKIDERDSSKGTIALTEEGIEKVEQLLKVDNLYDLNNINLIHHVEQALVAHHLYKRDVDYLVRSGEVLIVDEFTGRVQPGRRWSDGLHQAIEAKEKVKIKEENLSTATITYQNYFRLYNKLAGMTGTAETEAAEFHEIYKLDVVVIPTNKPMIRVDNPDVIYRTEKEKYEAVIQEIKNMNAIGRPVLVGTRSVGVSERLSSLLNRERIKHEVLNAKNHTKEAELIAHAGETGSVVIATNMAGRGVDIALSPEVREKGGLHIIGTERHESRRIDNQLRGRAGRQGDAGSSRFFLSLEDELMLKFGSEKLSSTMGWLGMKEGVPVEHPWVTKAIENAQKRVEAHNFEIRKHILKYDDVRNVQRKTIYEYRNMILKGENIKEEIMDMLEEIIDYRVDNIDDIPQKEESESQDLQDWIKQMFGINIAKKAQKPRNLPGKRPQETEDIYDEEIDPDMSRLDEPDTLSIDEIRDRMLKIFESGNKDNRSRDQIMDIKNRSKNQIMDILKRVIHDKIDNSIPDISEESIKIKRILRNLLDIYDENETNKILNEIGNNGGNDLSHKDPLRVKQLLLTLFDSQNKNAIIDVLEDTISNKIDISPNDPAEGTTKIKDLSEWVRQKFQIDMFQWEQKSENLSKEEIKNRLFNSLDLQEKNGIMDVLKERINTKADSASKELFKNIQDIRDFINWSKQVLRFDISQWKPRPEVLSNNEIKDKLCSVLFDLYDKDGLIDILKNIVIDKLDNSFQKKTGKMQGLIDWLNQKFQIDISQWEPKPESLSKDELKGKILSTLIEIYERKERRFGSMEMRKAERTILLDRIDFHWIEHLYSMDYMQEGIGLQAYAQKDPLVEFKKEAHDMFSDMFQRIKEEVLEYLFKFQLAEIRPVYQETSRQVRRSPQRKNIQELPGIDSEDKNMERHNKGFDGKVGRNDPCPCGSGKKYKKCCGLER